MCVDRYLTRKLSGAASHVSHYAYLEQHAWGLGSPAVYASRPDWTDSKSSAPVSWPHPYPPYNHMPCFPALSARKAFDILSNKISEACHSGSTALTTTALTPVTPHLPPDPIHNHLSTYYNTGARYLSAGPAHQPRTCFQGCPST